MFMNSRSRHLAFGLAALALLGFNVLCLAQSDRGSITGSVTDPSGGTVPNVAVTATNEATGVQSHTVTTGDGYYTIPNLPAASYSLTVEATGFSKLIRNGITVSVDSALRVDLALTVGSTAATVTVTADAPLLKTENPENGIIVTTQDINSLPLNMAGMGAIRDPLDFAELAPGTTVGGWNDIHINGAPGATYRVILDGQDSGSGLNPRVSDEEQPSVDALQEFALVQDSFPAEFGQTAGGIFNYTSKSGTNKIHGTVYEYFENEALDAGQPFTNNGNGGLVRPKVRQNDFGGSFGGPVWIPKIYNGRDKTFFFFNYEMYRDQVNTNNGFRTVPNAAERGGDFSSLLTGTQIGTDPLGRPIMNGALYDPSTTRTVNGQVVRDPFPNNQIPAGRLDPVAAKILAYVPNPVNNQATDNYPIIFPANKFQWIPSIKIDHSLTSNIHLSGYYALTATDKDNGGDGLPDPISARRYQVIRSNTVRINMDDVIRPTVVLHAGIGFQRYHNPDTTPITTFDQQSQLGLSGALVGGFPVITGTPQVNGVTLNGGSLGLLSGLSVSGQPTNGTQLLQLGPSNYQLYILNKPTAVASVSWIKGAHAMKFGGEWKYEQFLNRVSNQAVGHYSFDPQQTGLPSTNGQNLQGGYTGSSFASFLLGNLNTEYIGNVAAPWFVRGSGGIYAQDAWKVTPKLTLSYGLRYDLLQASHEQQYRITQFNPTLPNPSANNLPGAAQFEGYGTGRCNCTFEHNYKYAFGPRLGISYQADPKTVFHAAVGLFYAQQPSLNYPGSGNSIGFQWNTVTYNAPGFGLSAAQLSNGVKYSPSQLFDTNFNPGIYPVAGQLNNLPPWNYRTMGKPPRTVQTNVGMQHALSQNMSFEAAYVGVRGSWFEADGILSPDQLDQSRLGLFGLNLANANDRALLASPISSQAVVARGFTAPYAGFPSGASLAQALRPFPQFSSASVSSAMIGNYWYDSLQVKVVRRMSRGLWAQASYTWSKDLGTVNGDGGSGSAVPVAEANLSPKSYKTYVGLDRPQILSVSYRWQIPTFGLANNHWKSLLLDGWTTDAILIYQSGALIQIPNAQNGLRSITFAPANFANRVFGQPLYLHSVNKHDVNPASTHYLNPAAWSDPASGTYGVSKPFYSDYRNPRYPNEQMGLGKNFPIGERVNFSVRADFFNVFNRWALPALSGTSNALQTSQFGFIGTNISSAGSAYPPRSGEIVARIQF
jgi:Carboxypeptidase regulatory-like domain